MELLFTDINLAIYIYRYFLKYKSVVWFKYFFHGYNHVENTNTINAYGSRPKTHGQKPPFPDKILLPDISASTQDKCIPYMTIATRQQSTSHIFFLCLCLPVHYVKISLHFITWFNNFLLPFYFNSLYSLYLNLNHIYLYLCTHFGLVLIFIG